jgi:hypothetical protein
MARSRVTRRLTALGAATGLLCVAGLASAGVAAALPGDPTAATSVSPDAVSNAGSSVTSLTINGSGFNMLTNTVTLRPTITGAVEVQDIAGTVDKTNSTSTALLVTAPLSDVAPEPYDVIVATSSLPGSGFVTCAKCLTVTNPGRPTVSGVAVSGGGGYIAISGTNFAQGAQVSFLKPDLSVDAELSFVAGHADSNGNHVSGYASATSINGQTSHGANVAAGRHLLKVTNLDGQGSTQPVEFWQPKLTTTTPLTLGQGATSVPVSVAGSGIRAGSKLALSQYVSTNAVTGASSTTTDVTVGTATVSSRSDSITAPVSVSTAGGPQARTVSVTGPDGGFDSQPSLTVTAAPNPSGGLDVTAFGQGAQSVPVTVTGSGLQTNVVFSGGSGVVFAPAAVSSDGKTATTTVTVAPDATVGAVDTLTATNPDHGVGTLTGDGTPVLSPYPFTIDPGPVVTDLNPAGLAPGQSKTITLTGTGFDSNGMTLTASDGVSFSNVAVASATTASATLTAAADAPAGIRDVVVTNTADKGRYLCRQCVGVDSLALDSHTTSAANTNTQETIGFTALSGTLTNGRFVLHKTGSPAYQPDLTGTSAAVAPDGKTATATFDLSNAAPGRYNAVVTTAGGALFCTGCFTITGTDFTLAASNPLTPATGGQGAHQFPITVHGSNFARGEKITIAGTTVSDTSFVNPTLLTATITIGQSATVGQVDVTVASSDHNFSHTLTKGYTIVAAPTLSSVKTDAPDQTSLGQGARNAVVHLVGSGFTAGRVNITGTGLTVTTTPVDATHLTAAVTVAPDAPTGGRDVTVTNADNGGTSTPLAAAIVITPKPVVNQISPATLLAGKTATMTLSGAALQSDTTVVNSTGITFSNSKTAADGNSIVTTIAVAANAAAGVRHLAVTNSDGGTGSCTCDFTVVVPTRLSSVLPARTISGTAVTVSGTLINSNTGAAVSNARVLLTFKPAVGAASTRAAVTNTSGRWSIPFRPTYSTTTTVSYPGDSSHTAAAAVSRTIAVATRVAVTSPKPGASSPARSVLVVKGGTSPNKAGLTAYLYRIVNGKKQLLARARIASNGSYALAVKLAKGGYTLQVGVQQGRGNTFGNSPRFSHRRT